MLKPEAITENFNAPKPVEKLKRLNVRVSIIREIALTYISCVFRRSVASASRRVCSRRVDASCHGAPPGPLGRRWAVDSSPGAHCSGQRPSGSLWTSW